MFRRRVGGPALARSRACCMRLQCNEHQRRYGDEWYVVHTHNSSRSSSHSDLLSHTADREGRGHRLDCA